MPELTTEMHNALDFCAKQTLSTLRRRYPDEAAART